MNAKISIFIFRMQSSLTGLQESLQMCGCSRRSDQCQGSLKCGHYLNVQKKEAIILR